MESCVESRDGIRSAGKVERFQRPRNVIQDVRDLMAISVLGPLQVTVGGRPVALPAKQRTLLADPRASRRTARSRSTG